MVSANGIKINYVLEGQGSVVAMSHSLACNLHMWDEQAKALASRYRVLRFDTRGHGRSDAPAGVYTLEQMADDVAGLLAALGIEQTHFVGLSLGGMIGQALALKYPRMMKSLTLCDTTSRYPPEAAAVWEERIQIVQAQGMEPVVEPTLGRWFNEPFRIQHREAVGRVAAMIRATPPSGYIGGCHAIQKVNYTDRLGELNCPALIVVGEDDPATPVAMAREIHNAIADSKLAVLPRASHLSNIEQTESFNRTLLNFLDRVS